MVKIFEEELKLIHKELSEVLAVDNLRKYTLIIKEIGEKHQIAGLLNYSNAIQSTINNFNLDKIKKLLSYFPEISNIIKPYKE